jgi:TatD DNase family protein
MIDSHCHLDRLDLTKYNGDLGAALLAAKNVGVEYFLCPGIDLENFPNILQIAKKHQNIVVSVGLHPSENLAHELKVEELCNLADDPLVVGVGETGLDYFYAADENQREFQRQRFITHIRAAKELKKPLIVHSRSAALDLLQILRQENVDQVGGVLHCFTEDWETAQAAMDLNFYIAFSGIITFKNALALQQIAKQVPLERLLLETDAPYLAPVPMRGKPNEPAFLRYTAEFISKLRDTDYAIIDRKTSDNFFRLFKVPRGRL